jgi:hypothetical protein
MRVRAPVSPQSPRLMCACALVSMCWAAPTLAQETAQDAPSGPAESIDAGRLHRQQQREQRDHFLWTTFGPPGLVGAAVSGGVQHARDVPSEWGQSRTAFAKRFAAQYAESAVGDTTKYALARLFDGDPSFRRCECAGLLPRLRHASLSPFTARREADGRTVFSIARAAGLTAGHVASATLWYPAHQTAGGVAEHVALDLAAKAGIDVMREFVRRKRGGG